jgi:cytochrome c553
VPTNAVKVILASGLRSLATLARATPRLVIVALAGWAAAAPAGAQLYNERRPPRPDVGLPDGPVRQVILRSCTACHGIDEYGYYAMDRGAWDRLVDRMKVAKSGVVEGAVISDADRELLLDWLVAEFGLDATPFARKYVIPKLTAEDLFSDARAHALLDKACVSCHSSADELISTRLTEEGWRETLVGKLAKGAELLIDEVDPLIEWIMRARAP